MIKIKLNVPAILLCSSLVLLSCSTNELDSETQELNTLEDIESITKSDAIPIPGQYIILFSDENLTSGAKSNMDYVSSKKQVQDFALQLFTEKNLNEVEFVHTYSKSVVGATVKLSKNQVEELKRDKRVSLIEQDRIYMFAPPCGTPNGGPCPPDDGGGDGGDPSQDTPWGITRVNGVESYTGSNVAYILDSGIDLTHEDLNVNASLGFNAFSTGQDGNSLNDLNGHGTHVAGTVAAKNNNVGVIGVAPGATVVPVKVLDRRGSGSYSGVIAGVDFVAANASNGDVANMSLGGPVSTALDNAVISAAQNGIKFTLAAGNESQDANNTSPARANGTNVYTISAMSEGDNWASFSNFANPPVDYCAPGVSVLSTWKGNGYRTLNGTSMAAPHAAGVLLLGSPGSDGTVNNDPDGTSDPIIVN